MDNSKKGFTLLELLIVIAILAILAGIILMIINPMELLKKARDSKRVSDLSALKNAIGLYVTEVDSPQLDGTSTANLCSNYIWYSNLYNLSTGCPSGKVCIHPSSTASSTQVDSTGWLPVNFLSIQEGSPISSLPLDPKNNANYYYTYSCNEAGLTYEINTKFESEYYASTTNLDANDGGNASGLYEIGTDPNLDLLGDEETGFYGTCTYSSINYGDEAMFYNGGVYNTSVGAIDSTHFVVAYSYPYKGTARIGTVSGDSITYSSEAYFYNDRTSWVSVAVLDSTHFVVAYNYYNSAYGKARVGVIDNNLDIHFGQEFTFDNSGLTSNISADALNSTQVIIAYTDNGDSYYGKAVIGNLSGTSTLSFGQLFTFKHDYTNWISASALDNDTFIVAYKNETTDHGEAIVGNVSGASTISFGASKEFSNSTTTNIATSKITSDSFLVASYQPYDGNGKVVIGTVSGTSTLAFGTASSFNNASTNNIDISILDSSHFIVVYSDSGANKGNSRIGTISGTSISSFSQETEINPHIINYTSVAKLSETLFVASYLENEISGYGKARIGVVE